MGRFGLEIRILREKLCSDISSNQYFVIFLKNEFLIKPVFGYFFTFEGYFEAWEHQNPARHEKIPPGSYYEIFWPDGKLIGARSKLAPLFVLVKVLFSAAA